MNDKSLLRLDGFEPLAEFYDYFDFGMGDSLRYATEVALNRAGGRGGSAYKVPRPIWIRFWRHRQARS